MEKNVTTCVVFGALALLGARIIMACRDLERAEEARADILEDTGNENMIIRKLDLSDTRSIRAFAELINKGRQLMNICCCTQSLLTVS